MQHFQQVVRFVVAGDERAFRGDDGRGALHAELVAELVVFFTLSARVSAMSLPLSRSSSSLARFSGALKTVSIWRAILLPVPLRGKAR